MVEEGQMSNAKMNKHTDQQIESFASFQLRKPFVFNRI